MLPRLREVEQMSRKLTYENAIAELELINKRLSEEGVGLDDMIKLYERGMELAAVCTKRLNEYGDRMQTVKEKYNKEMNENE